MNADDLQNRNIRRVNSAYSGEDEHLFRRLARRNKTRIVDATILGGGLQNDLTPWGSSQTLLIGKL